MLGFVSTRPVTAVAAAALLLCLRLETHENFESVHFLHISRTTHRHSTAPQHTRIRNYLARSVVYACSAETYHLLCDFRLHQPSTGGFDRSAWLWLPFWWWCLVCYARLQAERLSRRQLFWGVFREVQKLPMTVGDFCTYWRSLLAIILVCAVLDYCEAMAQPCKREKRD